MDVNDRRKINYAFVKCVCVCVCAEKLASLMLLVFSFPLAIFTNIGKCPISGIVRHKLQYELSLPLTPPPLTPLAKYPLVNYSKEK